MKRIWEMLLKLIDWISGICLVCLVGLVSVQVFLRYIYGKPFKWGEELATFLFIWIVFMGSIVLVHKDGHLSLTIISERITKKHYHKLNLFFKVVIVFFLFLIFYNGLSLLKILSKFRSPAMHVSLAWLFSAVVIFAVVSLIEYIRQIYLEGRDIMKAK